MNRNTKHPERQPHRRRVTATDRTRNTRGYLITGSWNHRPDRPAVKPTSDRNAARRIARSMADKGAYVVVEQRGGNGEWSTWFEVDGPAQAAERRRVAAEEYRRREQQRAAAERSERDRADLARMMARPPVARDQCGRREARHVTGAQR